MIQHSNDMDNVIETESKTRYSTTASKPGEMEEPPENTTELQETLHNTTRSGRRVIKPFGYGEQRIMKILIAKQGCYV